MRVLAGTACIVLLAGCGGSGDAAIASASRAHDFPALRSEVDAANVELSRARPIAKQQGVDESALLGRVDR